MDSSVLVLGASGMLGSAVSRELSEAGIQHTATTRSPERSLETCLQTVPFDADSDTAQDILAAAGSPDFVINAIGITKPHIDESDIPSRLRALRINGQFPHELARAAEGYGGHVIQIATDCVYSGTLGLYDESALHDATDVYGKTKSLGEAPSSNMTHLRCSIIGPEIGRSTFLWEWLANQPPGATVNGFTNHLWNGVTTQQFGRICAGLIKSGERVSGVHHVVPRDIINKAELLEVIAEASGRDDIVVSQTDAVVAVDRTLATQRPEFSEHLWNLAGHERAPTIRDMVLEAGSGR